jgi:hypothetical protein
MLMTPRQVLRFPLSHTLSGEAGSGGASIADNALPKHKGKLPVVQIKQRMELVLSDIKSLDVDRLLYKIRATLSVNELWMLRSDMHHVIAVVHSQSEAARRINSLLPCFSQWISTKQLIAI